MTDPLRHYRQVWVVDFEFQQPDGEHPHPICMVGREYRTGRVVQVWEDRLQRMDRPPFPVDADSLFVCYSAPAELSCFKALGWPVPVRILDLYVEAMASWNGIGPRCPSVLVTAMAFGLDCLDAAEKQAMRELAIRGGPFTDEERDALLAYCAEDVDLESRLLTRMLPRISLPHALFRGRYQTAVTRMEWSGVPLDVDTLSLMRERWDDIKTELIRRIDSDYGVFDGTTFKQALFARWLADRNMAWPLSDTGKLKLDRDSFKEMARVHPELQPLRELKHALDDLKLESLCVGRDGRNRVSLMPFASRSGRNQPSNSKWIFGPSVWLRGLIRPEPGRFICYADWSGQEYGIAAYLSGDANMIADYASGDPYLAFGRRVGMAPDDATKRTHGSLRERLKTSIGLGSMYGAGADAVALQTGFSASVAREILREHRRTYSTFWAWSDAAINRAMLTGRLTSVFGWTFYTGSQDNPRTIRNFPMQSGGASMLQLAACLLTERGIEVHGPIHDALLVGGPESDQEDIVREARQAMAEASRVVLAGPELRTDAEEVTWPDRYSDSRGAAMWDTVAGILRSVGTSPVINRFITDGRQLYHWRCNLLSSFVLVCSLMY